MKRLLLTLLLLLTCILVWAGKPAKVQTIINEYCHHDGFERVWLGPLTILDFEDARADVKERFLERVSQILRGMDLILETKSDGETMRIYGRDNGDSISNCILLDPSGTIICYKGRIKLERLLELADD